MAEISAASQEQTSGIEQINQAISQMDNVTQQNASLVEEAAAASEALQTQAAKLAELVSVFQIGDRAPAAAPRTAVRAEPVMNALAAPAARRAAPVIKPAPARAPEKAPARTAAEEWEAF
jgi:methyl-accepting chemotaxis protein